MISLLKRLLKRLLGRTGMGDGSKPPPRRTPDPEIAKTDRLTKYALSKYDAAIKRRERLNSELAHAEQVLRGSHK